MWGSRAAHALCALCALLLLAACGGGGHGAAPHALALASRTACAVDGDGQLWCWGSNLAGIVDPMTSTYVEASPRRRSDLHDVRNVALGERFGCVLHGDRTVSCFGSNDHGELGDGTTAARTAPVHVAGLANIDRVIVGPARACAREQSGRWWCWGTWPADPLLGLAAATASRPVEAARAFGAQQIGLALYASAMITASGGLEMFGYTGTAPTLGPSDVQSIAVGEVTVCALLRSGSVECWETTGGMPRNTLDEGTVVGVRALSGGPCVLRDGDALESRTKRTAGAPGRRRRASTTSARSPRPSWPAISVVCAPSRAM